MPPLRPPFRPPSGWILTPHALTAITRRRPSTDLVARVLLSPEQGWEVRPKRWFLQPRTLQGTPPRIYLVRILVDVDREPPEIVTAYRTSKIMKYWRRD